LTYEPATSILTHSQTRDLSNLVFFESETENLKIYQFSSYSSKSNFKSMFGRFLMFYLLEE
jgi:hypothetical protein